MIKGDCFTPKYEDFELEDEIKPEEIINEDEGESGTYEKNKVDQSTTDLWEFRTTIKEIFLNWSPAIIIKWAWNFSRHISMSLIWGSGTEEAKDHLCDKNA